MNSNTLVFRLFGSYSYRVYINLIFFKIVLKRVTKDFDVRKEIPFEFTSKTLDLGNASVTVERVGDTLYVRGYVLGTKVGEYTYDWNEIIKVREFDLPKLEYRNSWIDAALSVGVSE